MRLAASRVAAGLAAVAVAATGACAGEPSDPVPEGVVAGFVLEQRGQGPRLCVDLVLTSRPPHCEGVELIGWDWDAVTGEESSGGATWVRAQVAGVCQPGRFIVAWPQPEHSVAFQSSPTDLETCYGLRSRAAG